MLSHNQEALRTIGAMVKTARERRSWTQERLGKMTDISERTVWAIENGIPVRVLQLILVLDALDLSLEVHSGETAA